MKKVSVIEIWRFVKWFERNRFQILKRFFTQIKTRYWCKKIHNQWWQNSMLHGVGKYTYTGYECQKCKTYHYEFKLTATDEKKSGK